MSAISVDSRAGSDEGFSPTSHIDALSTLRHRWQETVASLQPALPELDDFLTESLDRIADQPWHFTEEKLVAITDESRRFITSLSPSNGERLSARLRRAVYEFLLRMDTLPPLPSEPAPTPEPELIPSPEPIGESPPLPDPEGTPPATPELAPPQPPSREDNPALRAEMIPTRSAPAYASTWHEGPSTNRSKPDLGDPALPSTSQDSSPADQSSLVPLTPASSFVLSDLMTPARPDEVEETPKATPRVDAKQGNKQSKAKRAGRLFHKKRLRAPITVAATPPSPGQADAESPQPPPASLPPPPLVHPLDLLASTTDHEPGPPGYAASSIESPGRQSIFDSPLLSRTLSK